MSKTKPGKFSAFAKKTLAAVKVVELLSNNGFDVEEGDKGALNVVDSQTNSVVYSASSLGELEAFLAGTKS